MMALFTRQQIALAGICAVLTLFLIYEWTVDPAIADVEPARWHPRNVAVTLPLAPPFPTSESVSGIDARPLFNPARKPVEVPKAKPDGGTTVPPPNDVALVGVIIDGDRRLALLHTPQSPLAISAVIGQAIGGWTVTGIEPDHIVLNSGSNDYTINLNAKRIGGPADATGTPPGSADRPATTGTDEKPSGDNTSQ